MKSKCVFRAGFVGLLIAGCLVSTRALEADDSLLNEVISAFEIRMSSVRNIRFKLEKQTDVHYDNRGQIGDLKSRIPPRRYEYWQLDDSNRQDTVLTNEDGSLPSFSSNFDAIRGQGVTRSGTADRPQGYIDSKRDPLMNRNRYRFWLNIRDWGTGESEYIFNYFLDHKNSALVAEGSQDGLLKVSTNYLTPINTAASEGMRIHWLDPQKAFLPTRGFFEWKDLKSGLHRIERVEVTESSLVDDIWMPVCIKEHISTTFSNGKTIHNLHTIRVTEMEIGKVTSADLEIQFPPNTFFVDAIKGISYIGDEKGNPIGPVEPTVSRAAVFEAGDLSEVQDDRIGETVGSRSSQWQWFVRINVFLVASLGLIYFVVRFQSTRS